MESLTARQQLPKCPREGVSWISYLTFSWVMKIFFKGRAKTLGPEDLYQPLQEQHSDSLGARLEEAWQETPNLRSCFVKVFGVKILRQGLILLFIECGIKILPPIFLSRIIAFYSRNGNESQAEAVWYSIGIVLAILLHVLILHAFNVTNLNLGFMMKTGTCSLIYRKCLKLSKTTIGNITTGKIVNMMTNDVGK